MGLRESRILQSVHPWLGVRLRWMGEVARIVGSGQSLISGVRTTQEQRVLYDSQGQRPAAFPGCSQHQYGFAADATWLPITQISSKGRLMLVGNKNTNEFMGSAARHVGLQTVSGDPGHLQVYPGSQFKAWAVSQGFCNPNPPPPVRFVQPRNDLIFRTCGVGADSVRFGLFGAECLFDGNWV